MSVNPLHRTYKTNASAWFTRNVDEFGAFSNIFVMPVQVGSHRFSNSEALYHCLRLQNNPEAQLKIMQAHNGMAAKIVAYKYEKDFRPDWHQKINGATVKIACMRFTIWQKIGLSENREQLIELIKRSGNRPIVERSRKDDFWGAKPFDDILVGQNILGRLWMEVRQKMEENPDFPNNAYMDEIPDIKLFGETIPHPYVFGGNITPDPHI